MKTLVVALMLIATMMLPAISAAAPKHANKHAHAADASTDAAPADVPAPEVVDTSFKGKVAALVVGVGGGELAAKLGIDPAWLGLIAAILLLVVLLVLMMALVRLLARVRRGPAIYAGDYSDHVIPEKVLRVEPSIRPVAARAAQQIAKSQAAAKGHDNFDVSKFLRSANTYFLRLQVAWDRGDLNDIREFASREIYVEFKAQLKQRGAGHHNKTGVDSLDAELLKLESGDGLYVASVKFSGMIREENHAAKSFMEVWSLTKAVASTEGWTLAGIQQFS